MLDVCKHTLFPNPAAQPYVKPKLAELETVWKLIAPTVPIITTATIRNAMAILRENRNRDFTAIDGSCLYRGLGRPEEDITIRVSTEYIKVDTARSTLMTE